MNAIPLLLLALSVCALWVLLRPGPSWRRKALLGMLAALAALQLTLRPLEWQLWPALLAWIPAALVCLRPRARAWLRALAAAVALTGSLLAAACAWVLPVFTIPPPTGPYAVGTRTLYLRDPGTARELAVQLWYPASAHGRLAPYVLAREMKPRFAYQAYVRTNSYRDAPILASAGAFPVLLFNPRWAGRRTQDTFLVEDLASHGYVVVAVEHPGNALRMLTSTGKLIQGADSDADAIAHPDTSTPAAVEALWNRELPIWIQDDRFALDSIQQSKWAAGRLDWSRTGAFGHSFGGCVSVALLGTDPRVRSAVNLDGWSFGALGDRTAQPMLVVQEGVDEHPQPPTGTESVLDAADTAQVDASFARYGGMRVFVEDTQHLDFTDQTLVSPLPRLTYTGPIPPARIREITRSLVLGFFDQTLKHAGTLPEYPEVHRWHPPQQPKPQSAP